MTARKALLPAALFLAVFAAFFPALGNGFVWDDLAFFQNAGFRGLGLDNLRWMTRIHLAQRTPLAWLSWAIDFKLWGLDPFGYHLGNILLHAANAVLLFLVGSRLFGAALPAFWAALFFALHPLRVESVAWACERRDVLCGFFFLGSILAYLDARKRASALLFALSLLSKPSAIALPLLLPLLDRLQGRREPWTAKIPFFALSLAAGLSVLWDHFSAGNLTTLASHGASARVAQSLYGFAFYLQKSLWPFGLSALHALPPDLGLFNARTWQALILCGSLALAGRVLCEDRELRRIFWAYYALMIFPVLGFFQNGFQIVAERYSYLPCLGLALAVGYAASKARTRIFPAAAVAVLGFLTWRQCFVWRDEASLWTRVVALEPGSAQARLNLGKALAERGDWEAARLHLEESARSPATRVLSLLQLGYMQLRLEKPDAAHGHFAAAVAADPRYALSHQYLGVALAQLGQAAKAKASFERALALDPRLDEARRNLEAVSQALPKAAR